MKENNVRTISDLHAVLASESRLGLLVALQAAPTSVTGLASILGISVSAVSQQLQKLRGAELVDFARAAQTVTYHLVKPVHPIVAVTLALLEGE